MISVSVPEQRLEPVAPFAAEQKHCLITRIQLELLVYLCRKSIDSFPQITVPACNVYRSNPAQIQRSRPSCSRICLSSNRSAPFRISTAHSPLRIVISADGVCTDSFPINRTASNVTDGTAAPVFTNLFCSDVLSTRALLSCSHTSFCHR